MGWLRLVGSIKSQVSFSEYCLFYRALLQKSPRILSILLTKATLWHPSKVQPVPFKETSSKFLSSFQKLARAEEDDSFEELEDVRVSFEELEYVCFEELEYVSFQISS